MKFSTLVVGFVLLLSVTSALPVDIPVSNQLQPRSDELQDLVLHSQEKRDILPLTVLFRTLNTTGTGVSLVKTAISIPFTQQQIIKFVGSLIETKNLTSLLEAADQSGLALDLVVMVLTHYEVIPGVTNIVNAYKGGNSTSSGGSSNGILGGLLSGLSSSNDSDLGSGTSSGSLGALGNLLGGDSSSAADSGSPTGAASSPANSLEGSLGNLLGGLGLALASSLEPVATSATTAPSNGNPAASAPANPAVESLAAASPASAPAVAGSGNVNTAPAQANTETAANPAQATPAATTAATNNNGGSSGSGGLLGGLLNGVGSLLNGIAKREDLSQEEKIEMLNTLIERRELDLGNIIQNLETREFNSEEEAALAKRDVFDTVYLQIIRIIGSNSNILEIAESLEKSGLAISVIYSALTDKSFQNFDVNLIKYLVEKKLITLSSLFTAITQSGLLFHLIGDIVGNTSYVRLVINFVFAILNGKINILGLIRAFF